MAGFIRIAHRGSSGSYPENTRIAFEKAIEAQADMIEMDCQLSKDGHVVVFHDERLNRTAKTSGWVKSKSLQQLKKLDVGAWLKRSFKGERILILEEAMEIIAGKADVILDIKTIPKGPLGIELKVLFTLSHYDYFEHSLLSSFDFRTLQRLRELAPDARIGILYRKGMKEEPLQLAWKLRAHSLLLYKDCISADLVEQAGELGLKTFVWTVNEISEMDKFLSLGVDGIVSDFPEKFWKVRQRKR